MKHLLGYLFLISLLAACRQAPSLKKRFAAYEEQERLLEQEYNGMWDGYDTITAIQRKADRSALLARKFQEIEDFRLAGIRKFAGTELALQIIHRHLLFYRHDYKSFTRAVEALGKNIPESEMRTAVFEAYERLKAKQLTGGGACLYVAGQGGAGGVVGGFPGEVCAGGLLGVVVCAVPGEEPGTEPALRPPGGTRAGGDFHFAGQQQGAMAESCPGGCHPLDAAGRPARIQRQHGSHCLQGGAGTHRLPD